MIFAKLNKRLKELEEKVYELQANRSRLEKLLDAKFEAHTLLYGGAKAGMVTWINHSNDTHKALDILTSDLLKRVKEEDKK